jgi:hypothetical protein
MKMFEYHDYLLPFKTWRLYSYSLLGYVVVILFCSPLGDGGLGHGHKKTFCIITEGNSFLFKKNS